MVVPGTLFEELGFNYIGPVDGHDVQSLVHTLKNMRSLKGPQLLHIMTKKGKGYAPAEQDPISWHAVPKFDPASGTLPKNKEALPTYSAVFGEWLKETAAADPRLMAITPAMREGSGMVSFSRTYPQQYFDVAIAEQHAVTFAAGLAIGGYRPVVAIYSTFLQRAYDQVIHDVAIQNLPVLFAIDRGGIVGADGQTHQGAFDLSFLRCIPQMVIMTPSDENECRLMLHTGYHYQQGPCAVRYPRGNVLGVELTPLETLPIGKGVVKRQGEKVAILNFGTLLPEAQQAADALNATLVDMRFVKPLDEALVASLAASHDVLVTLEENAVMGGAGSGVNEYLMANRLPVPYSIWACLISLFRKAHKRKFAPSCRWMPLALNAAFETGWPDTWPPTGRKKTGISRFFIVGSAISAKCLAIGVSDYRLSDHIPSHIQYGRGDNTGDNIVNHDAHTAVHVTIKPTDRPRFKNIQDPENHKPDGDPAPVG